MSNKSFSMVGAKSYRQGAPLSDAQLLGVNKIMYWKMIHQIAEEIWQRSQKQKKGEK